MALDDFDFLSEDDSDLDSLIKEVRSYSDDASIPVSFAGDTSGEEAVESDSALSFSVIDNIESEKEEFEDILSSSPSIEIDGQENLFAEENESDFNIDEVELDTVIIPEQEEVKSEKFPGVRDYMQSLYDEKTDFSGYYQKSEHKSTDINDKPVEEKDLKERFLSKMDVPPEDDINVVPLVPVDRSGFIVKNNGVSGDGLEVVPTIIAAEALTEEKSSTKILPGEPQKTVTGSSDKLEGQIILSEFVEKGDENLHNSEGYGQQNNEQSRHPKAEKFRISTPDDDFAEGFDEQIFLKEAEKRKEKGPEKKAKAPYNPGEFRLDVPEFDKNTDKNYIYGTIKKALEQKKTLVTISGVLEIILIIFSFLPSIIKKMSFEGALAPGGNALAALNAVILIVIAAINYEKLLSSFKAIAKGCVTSDFINTIAVLLTLLHSLFTGVKGEGVPLCALPGLAIFISALSDCLSLERILGNFSLAAFKYNHNYFCIHNLENETESFEIGRGLLMNKPKILYSSPASEIFSFMKNSKKEEYDHSLNRLLLILTAAFSLISAAVGYIYGKSIISAVTFFTLSFCLSSPFALTLIPSYRLYSANKALNKSGSFAVNEEAITSAAAVNAVTVNETDLIDPEKCMMHGFKDFGTMRVDDVLLYAAAMVIKSGGPLRECFRAVIDGRDDLLPKVKELFYEDKMGMSGRISEQKVLMGNKNLMQHHNIEIPTFVDEKKLSTGGKKVLYLACNGVAVALFVVSYGINESVKPFVQGIASSSVAFLVKTNDVNITDSFISEQSGLSSKSFSIISSVGAKLLSRRRDTLSDALDSSLIHNGDAATMLEALALCCKYVAKNKLVKLLLIAFCSLGFLFTLFSSLVGLAEISGFLGAVLMGIFTLLATMICRGRIVAERRTVSTLPCRDRIVAERPAI